MRQNDPAAPHFSRLALYIFDFLRRRGGSMRLAPLLQETRLTPDDLATAVNELAERCWVNIEWRAPRDPLPEGIPERFREAERVTTTRFGRYRASVTWPTE